MTTQAIPATGEDAKTLILALPRCFTDPTQATGVDGRATVQHRFLTLPHPRTHLPTYYLASPSSSDKRIYELSTTTPSKSERSWFISSHRTSSSDTEEDGISNQIHTPSTLHILLPISPFFLVLSILSIVFPHEGKVRWLPYEDIWDEAALLFYRKRREKFDVYYKKSVKGLSEVQAEEGEEWEDVVAFGAVPGVKETVERSCTVQTIPNAPTTYRLSPASIYAVLDSQLARLANKSTFDRAPNTLGRSFDRRYDGAPGSEESDDAQQVRRQVAIETIMGYLTPEWAGSWTKHLDGGGGEA